jgi:DNA primase catalytic subunit
MEYTAKLLHDSMQKVVNENEAMHRQLKIISDRLYVHVMKNTEDFPFGETPEKLKEIKEVAALAKLVHESPENFTKPYVPAVLDDFDKSITKEN